MALRVFGILFLAAALFFRPAAQVIVEDEIVTSDVKLFDVRVQPPYNITAAMGMSLIIPGAGHYYVDKPVNAFVHIAIDAASIFGALVFNNFANQREKDARSFAMTAAGIVRAPKGEAYWRHVGAFMDAAEYNDAVELSRNNTLTQYLEPDTWWRWGDESQKDEYSDLRQKARNMRVASQFFIGAMAVNRIVSAVDLRVSQRKILSRGIRFEAALSPDMNGAAVELGIDF